MPGIRQVPRTGVIYVMHEAGKRGFVYGHPDWANLGQGSPESGDLPGAPPRVESIKLTPAQHAYGPVEGWKPLRQKVADFYNGLYRKGKKSQYTYENVCLAGGGRAALTRLAASIAPCNIGHFIPDYTAYEELLANFRSFIPIPILLDHRQGYRITKEALETEIAGRGLRLVLISNPCNPTGQVVEGQELSDWVELARTNSCTFVFDEFYSHFLYTGEPGRSVSAASFVEDVEEDPIVIGDIPDGDCPGRSGRNVWWKRSRVPAHFLMVGPTILFKSKLWSSWSRREPGRRLRRSGIISEPSETSWWRICSVWD